MASKGNILVLVLGGMALIFAAVAGLFYYQTQLLQQANISTPAVQNSTPKNDETANWKTYTSSQNFYEFRYPETWILTECNPKTIILENHKADCNQALPDSNSIVIAILPNYSVNLFLEDDKKTYDVTTTNKEVAGITGTDETLILKPGKTNYPNHTPYGLHKNFIVKDNSLYVFYVITVDNSDDTASIYNQILSTFKFNN